jgi:CubicO group peptidase (beta-lactamase class C family)
MYHFLRSLRRNQPHGEKFVYHSAHTDALAWLCESVTGKRYPSVLSERLWARIGALDNALIGVDRGGFSFANGAVNCTPRDLARIGRMMLNGGSLDGEQIVSQAFVAATLACGDRKKGKDARWGNRFPSGSYRNQWWSTGNRRRNVYALGIHGQYIWLDPPSDTVIVKFSSQPDPLDGLLSAAETSLFVDIARAAAK